MFYPPSGCKGLYEHTRLLPIPGPIDDYNHHMGGVDIANQLRAGFSTQQRGVKPWRPLFYWCRGIEWMCRRGARSSGQWGRWVYSCIGIGGAAGSRNTYKTQKPLK
jgi:hypothetical protein